MKCRSIQAGLFLALFLLPAFCFGQAEITGRISGSITDSTGAVVAGANVKLESSALFAPKVTLSSVDGTFFLDKLPPGSYRVTFTGPGFKTLVQDEVGVRANFTATLNVALQVGAVQETVEVTAAAPVVDVRSATSATTFDVSLLQKIPSGRDTWSTLAQVPGLAPSKFDVGGTESFQQTATQVHGSAAGQTVYNINGLNLNWPGGSGGSTSFYFDNDAFQEIQVVTDAAQAEIGVGGAQINMITRSGSNQIHGSLGGYYTTAALTSAREYPEFNGRPIEAGTNITMMRDTNVQAGAPIIKNRAWIFGSYRRYDINLAVPAIKRLDGTAIKDNNQQGNVTTRLDLAITDKQTLSLHWLYNDILRFYRRGTGFVDDVASGQQLEHAWVGQAQWTYSPTPGLTLESRFGNMTLHFPQLYQPEVLPGTVAVIDTILNTTKYARPAGNTLNHTWHIRGSQNVSWFKSGWLKGSHNIRGGVEYARMSNGNRATINRDINVRLANGVPLNALLFNTPLASLERVNETATYVQDSWMLGRFTFNVGLRFDRFLTYLPAQTSEAGSFTPARSFPRSKNVVEWNNFAPRIGFAFDPTGRGRSVVRASYSHFMLLEGSRLAAAVNPNASSSSTVTFTRLGPDNYPLDLSTTPVFQEGGRFTTVDPNLTRPYSRQATVGFEQQLLGDLRLSLGYYFRDTRNNFSRVNRAAQPSDYSPLTVLNPVNNEPLTIYNLARDKVGLADYLITNFSRLDDNAYHAFEISGTKRLGKNWQMLGGITIQRKLGTLFNATGDDLNDPNRDIFRKNARLDSDSPYVFKLAGTYRLPQGLSASMNFQHYTGYPFTPEALFRSGVGVDGTLANLNQNSVTVPLMERGQRRLDAVNLLSVRVGYALKFGERWSAEPMIDLYNVTNQNTVTGMIATIGPNFERPETVLGQRFIRFGLRIDF